MKVFLPVAGLFGFSAVLLSAIGTHYFQGTMSIDNFQAFSIATEFEMIHGIVLMLIGLFGFVTKKPFYLLTIAGYLFVIGVIFFCGDIYLKTVFDLHELVVLAPVGGIAFLLGWLFVFIAGIYYYFHAVHAHDM